MGAVSVGVLPRQEIAAMRDSGVLTTAPGYRPIGDDQIQPASIDLRLGDYAYPVDTSFLPGTGVGVMSKLHRLDPEYERFRIDLREGAALEKGRLYVIPLQERIVLPTQVAAFANPKSSTGRLDILTRLIADGGSVFDQVELGSSGALYAEVAPKSFSIVAHSGERLNQLRFRRGSASHARLGEAEWATLLAAGQIGLDIDDRSVQPEEPGKLRFTVDLQGADAPNGVVGWRAKKHCNRVDLSRRGYPPGDYWEPIQIGSQHALTLDPDEFYILMTREAVAVPPGLAAEMTPYDTRAGEFRVHYAGFFDPGFGWNAQSNQANGSRGVLEVRSHEVPFLLEHGQTVGWLCYEKMSEPPDQLYGDARHSHYQGQRLKLAKQFGVDI